MSSEKDIKGSCSNFSLSVVAAILASISGLASCSDLCAGVRSADYPTYTSPQAAVLLDHIKDLFIVSKESLD